ncbi:MAG: DegT/DnrJ/EryC1/StrS family aminotransferase [Deltaproteobacteria bacterium]|nr:DegT/DnrJ/EryC1/StrS family aminotransferase [Deltaproteobacteria bacterium]
MVKEAKLVPIACVKLSEQEIAAVAKVLRSGNLVAGAAVQAFEQQFASLIGARYAVAASSGTAALHVAYLATLKPDDEVLVPGFTHISTASMVHFAGARPVLCDVDRRTFTLSLEDAGQKLGPKTAALAPVHLFGNACDVDGISAFAQSNNLKIIWDAAQAHGTRYRGEDVGRLPDLVTYSFYPTKNMTTGEGGMIVTNDQHLYDRCKLLREHGQTGKYYHEGFGLNYRMLEVSGALGLEQLKQLPTFIEKRRRNAQYLNERLSSLDGITVPFVAEGIDHSFHQYSILLDLVQFRCSRDEFITALKTEGVEAAVHYPRALNQQPAFAAGHARLPNCEWLTERIMSLPVHPMLSAADLEQVADAVTKVADQMRR